MNFIQKTMDEMDCIPESKEYYIAMDNGSIHTFNEMDTMVTEREREEIQVHLSPSLLAELHNPLSNFGR